MAAMLLVCPSCLTKLRVPEAAPGQTRFRCSQCQSVFSTVVPAQETMPAVTPSPQGPPPIPVSAEKTETPAPNPQITLTLPGLRAKPPAPPDDTFDGRTVKGDTSLPTDKAAAPFQAPRLPGYEILEVLGRGGMGVVYKARQEGLNRLVAVKMILSGEHAGEEALTRFRTEGEAVARLQHPNIVQIYDIGQHEGLPFFSLEYCPGGSLARRIDGTPMAPRDAVDLVAKLARAVRAAHQHNVIHRDLKPANILLDAEGEPKVTDFGLAKKLDDVGHTQSGSVIGSPSYMAPEQARGDTKAIGPQTDVYALGAILYELLTGRPPFKSSTQIDTVMRVIHEEPVPPSQLEPKVPRDLETICLKCLQKTPERRYADALALAEDLRRFRAGEPIAARPVGRLERSWRWCRRNPAVAGLVASVAVLLLTGSVVGWYLAWEANQARRQADQAAWDADLAAYEAKKQAQIAKDNEREAKSQTLRADLNAKEAVAKALLAEANEKKAHIEAERARKEKERANHVARFLVGLFDAADPIGLTGYAFGPDPNRGSVLTAKELLDQGARKIRGELKDEPEVRAALVTTIGSVYRTMGLHKQAKPLLEEGLALRRKALGDNHLEVAESWFHLGWLFHHEGEDFQALDCYEKALAILKDQPGAEALASRCRFNTAWILAQRHDNEAAEALFKEVLQERRKRLGEDDYETAVAKTGLASVYFQTNRALAALPLVQSAMETFRKYQGDEGLATAGVQVQSVLAAVAFGQYDDAERDLLKIADTAKKRLGEHHPYVAWTYGFLGEIMTKAGRPKDAEKYYALCLQICKDGVAMGHPLVLRAIEPYAAMLAHSGRYPQACQVFEDMLAYQIKRRGERHPMIVQGLEAYAAFAHREGKKDEAEALYRRAVEMVRLLPEGACPDAAEIVGSLALIVSETRPAEAIALYRESLTFGGGKRKPETELKAGLAQLLFRLRWYSEAAPLVADLATEGPIKGKGAAALATRLRVMRSTLPALLARETEWHASAVGFSLAGVGLEPLSVPADMALLQADAGAVRRLTVGRDERRTLTFADSADPIQRGSYHQVFEVDLKAGVTYRIHLASRDFDAFLRLEAPEGRILASDDDSGGGLDARIDFRCTASGPYRIVVTTFEPNQVGDFVLGVRAMGK